ncbi:MAG: methylenetetrahydrofolate reductase [Desulfovibrionaceae bacterium]|nr:methylenetetrahydrofolate reductase [Desulfovibrionaceae bacterium]
MNIAQKIATQTAPFYSFEFFPPREGNQIPAFLDTVRRLQKLNPLFASVTYGAGGSRQDRTLDIVSRIQNLGLDVMAHLTCVGSNGDHIVSFINRLREIGSDTVLALRGDLPAGSEIDMSEMELPHASDLIRFLRGHFPDLGIACAGYPAPHPESTSFASDWKYTVHKILNGADFVITQMFFDVREYFHFTQRLQALDVNIPVIPGVMPVQSFESIRRTLSLCGANIPGKLYLELEAAYDRGGNEAVREAGISYAVRQIRMLLDGGAPGIHLYTLNNAETCLRIAEQVGPLKK